jgi:hypothetical protein
MVVTKGNSRDRAMPAFVVQVLDSIAVSLQAARSAGLAIAEHAAAMRRMCCGASRDEERLVTLCAR